MIKFKTFLEAKNTTFYIDHNDKKQIVDLSGYTINPFKDYVTLNGAGQLHSYDDMPALITPRSFIWHRNGRIFRDNNLPAAVIKKNMVLFWYISTDTLHRTNGPAMTNRKNKTGTFHIHGVNTNEEGYVLVHKSNILKRIKEYPKDIQWYKVPNFELQKIALDLDFSVKELIYKFHPDFKDTKYAHLVTSQSAGLLD